MNDTEQKALSNRAIIALYREFEEPPPMDSPAYRAYVQTIDDATTINFSLIVAFSPRKKTEVKPSRGKKH